jgi:hypothetical protein
MSPMKEEIVKLTGVKSPHIVYIGAPTYESGMVKLRLIPPTTDYSIDITF